MRVAFLERDEHLRPEMGVRVVFDSDRPGAAGADVAATEAALLIPVGAVVKIGGESGVFVLERSRVGLRKVTLGAIVIVHIKGGKIAEAWNNIDQLALARQIGALSGGAPPEHFLTMRA